MNSRRSLSVVSSLALGALLSPSPLAAQGAGLFGQSAVTALASGAVAGKPRLPANPDQVRFTPAADGALPRRGDFDPRKDMPDLSSQGQCWGVAHAVLVHWAENMSYGLRRGAGSPDRSHLRDRSDVNALDRLLPLRMRTDQEMGREDYRLMKVTDRSDRNPTPEQMFQTLALQWYDNQDQDDTETRYDQSHSQKAAYLLQALRRQGVAQFSVRGWETPEEEGDTWGHALLAYRATRGALTTTGGGTVEAIAFDYADVNGNYGPRGAVTDAQVAAQQLYYIPSLETFYFRHRWGPLVNVENGYAPEDHVGIVPMYRHTHQPAKTRAELGGATRTILWSD